MQVGTGKTAQGEPSRIVFLLGMHRSGTSCLAGCLERCGLFLGRVDRGGVACAAAALERSGQMPWDVDQLASYNPRGHNEPVELNALQDEILTANGGDIFKSRSKITGAPQRSQ